MTKQELEGIMEYKNNDGLQVPCCMIEYQGEKGIVLYIGENLATGTWLSGDLIVHWEEGEHTILPDEFTLIKRNLWEIQE